MKSRISITVSPENFEWGEYNDPCNCPLTLAIMDKLNLNRNVCVIFGGALIEGDYYRFKKSHDLKLRERAEKSNQKPLTILLTKN